MKRVWMCGQSFPSLIIRARELCGSDGSDIMYMNCGYDENRWDNFNADKHKTIMLVGVDPFRCTTMDMMKLMWTITQPYAFSASVRGRHRRIDPTTLNIIVISNYTIQQTFGEVAPWFTDKMNDSFILYNL